MQQGVTAEFGMSKLGQHQVTQTAVHLSNAENKISNIVYFFSTVLLFYFEQSLVVVTARNHNKFPKIFITIGLWCIKIVIP